MSETGNRSWIMRGGMMVMLANVAGVGLRFLTDVLLGRFLAESAFGVWGLVSTTLSLGQQLLSAGLRSTYLRFGGAYAENQQGSRLRALGKRIFRLLLTGGCFLSLLIFLLRFHLADFSESDTFAGVIPLFCWAVPFLALVYFSADMLRTAGALGLFSLVRDVLPWALGLAAVGIVLVPMKGSLQGAVFANSLAILFSSFAGLLLARRELKKVPDREGEGTPLKGSMRHFALGAGMVGVFWILRERITVFLVSRELGEEQTAWYFASIRFLLVNGFVTTALNSLLAPKMSAALEREDKTDLMSFYGFATRSSLVMSLFVLIVFALLPDILLGYSFGEGYRMGAGALILAAGFRTLTLACGPVGTVMQMGGAVRTENILLFFSIPVVVVANLLLIPIMGITGAAIATYGTLFAFDFLRGMYVWKRFALAPLHLYRAGVTLFLVIVVCGSGLALSGQESMRLMLFPAFLLAGSFLIPAVFFDAEEREDWKRFIAGLKGKV